MVVIIERTLRWSRIIPRMPNTKAAGNENIISNPPRIARGLPQPGRSTMVATMVTTGMPSKTADIFAQRIFSPSQNSGYNLCSLIIPTLSARVS